MFDMCVRHTGTGTEMEMMHLETNGSEIIMEDGWREYKFDTDTQELFQFLDHTDDTVKVPGKWTCTSL